MPAQTYCDRCGELISDHPRAELAPTNQEVWHDADGYWLRDHETGELAGPYATAQEREIDWPRTHIVHAEPCAEEMLRSGNWEIA